MRERDWDNLVWNVRRGRSSNRKSHPPLAGDSTTGFRCARDVAR